MLESLRIKVDYASLDAFDKDGINSQELINLVAEKDIDGIDIQMHNGYDHSYYFVSSVIESHVEYHAKHLNQ